MDASEDMTKQLSEAVKAHFAQRGDLRDEIAECKVEKYPERNQEHIYRSHPPQSFVDRPSGMKPLVDQSYFHHHSIPLKNDDAFSKNQDLPLHLRRYDIPQFDERRVFCYSPLQMPYQHSKHIPDRHLDDYSFDAIRHRLPPREWPRNPPRHAYFSVDAHYQERERFKTEDPFIFKRNNVNEFSKRLPSPTNFSEKRQLDIYPRLHYEEMHRQYSNLNAKHLSPSRSSRSRPRPKHSNKRLPSRVSAEIAEEENESFDDILLEHKRSQQEKRLGKIQDELYFTRYEKDSFRKDAPLYSQFEHASLEKRHTEINQLDEHSWSKDKQKGSSSAMTVPSHLPSFANFEKTYHNSAEPFDPNASSDPTITDVPLANKAEEQVTVVSVTSPINQPASQKEMPDNDVEDEEEDEELLALRLAALSSAYTRNIGMAKEDSKSEEDLDIFDDNDDDDDDDREESKPKKKKSKLIKEKKKGTRKTSKSLSSKKSPRNMTNEKLIKFRKTETRSPDSIIEAFVTKSYRSPEKDFTDPKILTLGNEVMKKKSIHEQSQLREIRALEDSEEGYKRFMDIINSKNEREQKKMKNDCKKSTTGDNYEEIEMEMDDSIKPTTILLDTANAELDDPTNTGDPCTVVELIQPLPPGIDEKEVLDNTENRSQESIWELLEHPLRDPVAIQSQAQSDQNSFPADFLSAEKLISSIRANVDRQIATNEVPPHSSSTVATMNSSVTVDISNVASVDISQDNNDAIFDSEMKDEYIKFNAETTPSGADSPCDFEHAFDQPALIDSLPKIATDLNLIQHDECTSADLDDEAIEMNKSPMSGIAENDSQDGSDMKKKRFSIEEEEALREKLLQDLAARRARETFSLEQDQNIGNRDFEVSNNPVQSKPISANMGDTIKSTNQTVTLGPRMTAKQRRKERRKKFLAKKRAKKRQWKKRKGLRNISGTAKSVCQSSKTAITTFSIMSNQSVTNNKAASVFFSTSSTASQTVQSSTNVDNFNKNPILDMERQVQTREAAMNVQEQIQMKQGMSITNSSTRTMNSDSQIQTKLMNNPNANLGESVQTRRVTSFSKRKLQLKAHAHITDMQLAHQNLSITHRQNEVQSPSIANVQYQNIPPTTKVVDIPRVASNQLQTKQNRGSLKNQVTITKPATPPLHPPVVINLELSSDEEEHERTASPSATNNNAASKQLKRTLQYKKAMTKSASMPLLQHQLKSTKNRNSPSHSYDISKELHCTTTQSINVTNKATYQRNLLLSAEQPFANLQTLENSKLELSKVNDKLTKVRQLLVQDKVQLTRLKQKQEQKETEVVGLTKRAAALRSELEKTENLIKDNTQSVTKIKGDADKIANTMEKRLKLEAKFVHQVAYLNQRVQAGLQAYTTPSREFQENVETLTGSAEPEQNLVKEILHDTQSRLTQSTTQDVAEKSDSQKMEIGKNVHLFKSADTSPDKKKVLEGRSQFLREEKRNLLLQKEKLLLREREVKLLLIKQKAKQALKEKKLKKSSDQWLYQKQIKRRRSSLNTSQKTSKSSLIPRSGAATTSDSSNSAREKNGRKVSVSSKTTSATSASADVFFSSNKISLPEKQETSNPVTPTLKRSRNSSSGATTSTTLLSENVEWNNNDDRVSTLSPDNILKLRKNLDKILHPLEQIWLSSFSSTYSSLTSMYPTPTCFSNWLVDASELAGQPTQSSVSENLCSSTSQKELTYKSSLRNFRSYRLSPYFLREEKSSLSSNTFSHKINFNNILCRYDLNGKCRDESCKRQHLTNASPSPNEIYLDLLWYCPQLLKNNEGKQITNSDSLEIQLKAAEDTVARLCNGRQEGQSVEKTCRILVSIINRALGNKPPVSSVYGKGRMKMCPDDDVDDLEDLESRTADREEKHTSLGTGGKVVFSENSDRYYDDEDKLQLEIKRLNSLLKNDPTNEPARVQLARAYVDQSKIEEKQKKNSCVELALYTLCLGIETNDQSELLWSEYIPILRQHYQETNVKFDQVESLDQALMLLPLSKPVWDEIFKWQWTFDKLDAYYQQLLTNLLKRFEILKALQIPNDYEYSYFSSWLLLTVAERCHLLLFGKGQKEGEAMLWDFLNNFNQLLAENSSDCSEAMEMWPLSQEDLVKFWLIYIHLLECEGLPPCLYNQDVSSHPFGMTPGFNDVTITFKSCKNLKVDRIRNLFEDAIRSTSNDKKSEIDNAKNQLSLYRSLIDFEVLFENWTNVSLICKKLVDIFRDSSSLIDVLIMWTEAVMHSNDDVAITKTFDEAVTACPQSARLSYMASLYQLNSDNTDEEAAFLYLHNYIDSVLNLEGVDYSSAKGLQQLYRRLLRYNNILKPTSDLRFINSDCKAAVEKEKPYLWLIYCTLTGLVQSQDEDRSNQVEIADLYEAALHMLTSPEERKVVWIHYLLHLRSNAINVRAKEDKSSKRFILIQRKKQQAWLKHFTSIVLRCLETTPCLYNAKLSKPNDVSDLSEMVVDYSFHNEVCSIYLECFSKDQINVAYTILTDAMPGNIPLLEKAALYFRKRDPISAVSVLWRITSDHVIGPKKSCRNYHIWKMTAAGLISSGKHRKAIALYRRALTCLPRCQPLWKDILTLTLAYGNMDNFQALSNQCKDLVSFDINSVLNEVLATL